MNAKQFLVYALCITTLCNAAEPDLRIQLSLLDAAKIGLQVVKQTCRGIAPEKSLQGTGLSDTLAAAGVGNFLQKAGINAASFFNLQHDATLGDVARLSDAAIFQLKIGYIVTACVGGTFVGCQTGKLIGWVCGVKNPTWKKITKWGVGIPAGLCALGAAVSSLQDMK